MTRATHDLQQCCWQTVLFALQSAIYLRKLSDGGPRNCIQTQMLSTFPRSMILRSQKCVCGHRYNQTVSLVWTNVRRNMGHSGWY